MADRRVTHTVKLTTEELGIVSQALVNSHTYLLKRTHEAKKNTVIKTMFVRMRKKNYRMLCKFHTLVNKAIKAEIVT